jgi:hypothetical protein
MRGLGVGGGGCLTSFWKEGTPSYGGAPSAITEVLVLGGVFLRNGEHV